VIQPGEVAGLCDEALDVLGPADPLPAGDLDGDVPAQHVIEGYVDVPETSPTEVSPDGISADSRR
jgi:hypothetical protein